MSVKADSRCNHFVSWSLFSFEDYAMKHLPRPVYEGVPTGITQQPVRSVNTGHGNFQLIQEYQESAVETRKTEWRAKQQLPRHKVGSLALQLFGLGDFEMSFSVRSPTAVEEE